MVFGTGFVLGTFRVLLVVPLLGSRAAELIELPLMLAVTVLSAALLVRRKRPGLTPGGWLAVGATAVGLVLAAELAVGVGLRRMSPAEAMFGRDPVSGTAYYITLLAFALMPWLVARRRGRRDPAPGTVPS
jgi:hypothetical protein